MTFTLGGLYAMYEGVEKIRHPHKLTSPLVALVVLIIGIGLEGWALRTAAREANKTRGQRSWLAFIRRAKAPEIPLILLEDTAAVTGLLLALAGVGLTVLTSNGIFDGIATLLIGLLLGAVAILLAMETKSLLVGEAATPGNISKIKRALMTSPWSSALSICGLCIWVPTSCWSPRRSPSIATTTRSPSPPRSTPPRYASAPPYRSPP